MRKRVVAEMPQPPPSSPASRDSPKEHFLTHFPDLFLISLSSQVMSWKSKLPLQTIMRLLQVLVPQVEKICIDK